MYRAINQGCLSETKRWVRRMMPSKNKAFLGPSWDYKTTLPYLLCLTIPATLGLPSNFNSLVSTYGNLFSGTYNLVWQQRSFFFSFFSFSFFLIFLLFLLVFLLSFPFPFTFSSPSSAFFFLFLLHIFLSLFFLFLLLFFFSVFFLLIEAMLSVELYLFFLWRVKTNIP